MESCSIRCERSGKLLAKMSDQGIYLYCRSCKSEHFVRLVDLLPDIDEVTSQKVLFVSAKLTTRIFCSIVET